jgi:hypothetical protein
MDGHCRIEALVGKGKVSGIALEERDLIGQAYPL